MWNMSWQLTAEQSVSVPSSSSRLFGYRDRARTPLCGDEHGYAGAAPALFAHLTVNPLVSRVRARHG